MATKRGAKPSKKASKVKSLPAKGLSAKQEKGVKGGKVHFSDLHVTKKIDKASPKLYE
jgi:type VI protein secretion system component Hcp